MKTIEEQVALTVKWLQEQVNDAHCKGLVVGLSGGIDSSVCAALMVKAFPSESLGVILPVHSSEKDREDALALASAIGIKAVEISLSDEHRSIMENVTQQVSFDEKNQRLSDANLRARLRMSTIYAISNLKNYLVVGTDNAAEVYTGYFTKYGDGGVDILPIAALTKQEVYEWGAYLGIPKRILDRAPSAGLWEGQTDESEMGTTYACIDAHLRGENIPQRDLEIIQKLHNNSAHKRMMPPACPRWE
jgi:NAD+ synthase